MFLMQKFSLYDFVFLGQCNAIRRQLIFLNVFRIIQYYQFDVHATCPLLLILSLAVH